jgi:hypothetical protein
MIRKFTLPFFAKVPATARAETGAALLAGAVALFALSRAPAPVAPVQPSSPQTAAALTPLRAQNHSASYYPEHLAAMQSLGHFQPIADEGVRPTPLPANAPTKAAALDQKPPRRAETLAKTAAVAPLAPSVSAPAADAPAQLENEPMKIFGMALPGAVPAPLAQIGGHAAALRDAAANWTAATAAGVSEKAAALWR